jgi:hypothetical protein
MDPHRNARLTPKGREEMVRAVVDRGMSKAAAERRFNTTLMTGAKWVERFNTEGVDGLCDRPSMTGLPVSGVGGRLTPFFGSCDSILQPVRVSRAGRGPPR